MTFLRIALRKNECRPTRPALISPGDDPLRVALRAKANASRLGRRSVLTKPLAMTCCGSRCAQKRTPPSWGGVLIKPLAMTYSCMA
jgi:hypothetical protein